MVHASLTRASNYPREQLLHDRTKTSENRIFFSLLYSPLANQIKSIIFKHWHILDKILGCNQKPRVAMRKSRSSKDLVVHTDINRQCRNMGGSGGHFKCLNCAGCKYVIEGREFINPQDDRHYSLRQLTMCSSKFCVYAISCSCGLIYVGSTSRSVKIRILEHVARIRNLVAEAP